MPFSSPVPLTRSRLTSFSLGRPVGVYLLCIEFAGRAWRWSTEPVDLSTDAGEVYSYGGGLDALDIQRQIEALQEEPELLSVGVEIDWPGIAALIGQGHDLTTATGEIALTFKGEVWDDRYVLLNGPCSQPEYGYDGDPVALSVVEAPFLDKALYPPATARVTTETWASAPEDSEGLWYPQVFGAPGAFIGSDGAALEVPGSPALVVDYDTGGDGVQSLLINGSPVAATTCDIWVDGAVIADMAIATSTDGLGRRVATVDFSSGASVPTTKDERLAALSGAWAIWTGGGATLDDRTGSAITGAGALARWWLDRSTVRSDDGRWASSQRFLDRYTIGGYVDEQVVPWEFITDNLLDFMHTSVVAGNDGLMPVVWQWNASTADAVEIIRAEAGTVLDGRVEYLARPADLISAVRVSWALDDEARKHRRVTTCGPASAVTQPIPGAVSISIGPGSTPASLPATGSSLSDPDYHPSLLANTSATRAGGGGVEEIESDWIADDASAFLVAVNALAIRGYASRSVQYDCPQDVAWLELGDVVRLIDSDLSIDGVALVTGWQYLDTGRTLLTLTMPGQPLRDSRTTGPDPTGSTFDDPGGG